MNGPRVFAHTLVWVKRHLLKQLPVPEIDLLRPHVKAEDVLLDVGAHSGAWSVALSRLVPRGRVYAFEALPYYARVLRGTLWILRKSNIEVVGKPVLDEGRPVQMVWRSPGGEHLTGMTHVAGRGESSLDTVTVNGITLDEFLSGSRGHIRFIKMDTEGAELLALQGARHVLQRFRPFFYIELNETYCQRYGHQAEDVISFFRQYDYRGYQRHAGSPLLPVEAATYGGDGDVWFVPTETEEAFLAHQGL
ncbi:MAG: hypothetical protein COV99_11925 [Bacteroidetes bacterium CG12_big_fil_rev_8_21_14_0_65_60_17]|nr:MAG: hypothetical protein COV99_11925 [Bacteroidetes bacterium CG12_big_fil_rev_8_21_14_0_65_60_17]